MTETQPESPSENKKPKKVLTSRFSYWPISIDYLLRWLIFLLSRFDSQSEEPVYWLYYWGIFWGIHIVLSLVIFFVTGVRYAEIRDKCSAKEKIDDISPKYTKLSVTFLLFIFFSSAYVVFSLYPDWAYWARILLTLVLMFFYGLYMLLLWSASISSEAISEILQKASEVITKPHDWESLAKYHKLHFSRKGVFTPVTRIAGDYGDFYLELEGSRRKTSLKLSLKDSTSSPDQPIAPEFPDSSPLNLLTNNITIPLKGVITAQPLGRTFFYQQSGFEPDPEYLETIFNLLGDLVHSYPTVLALGGEAVAALQLIALDNNHHLKEVAFQLLKDIEKDTTYRFAKSASRVRCPHCLTKFGAHKVSTFRIYAYSISYYGCRTCHQSRDFLEGQEIVAVLNSKMKQPLQQTETGWQINWLAYNTLFDFDRVEIINASDEEVERFAIQVGNDMDQMRKPLYSRMNCTISVGCKLSDNTLRILQHTFAKIERKGFSWQKVYQVVSKSVDQVIGLRSRFFF